MRDKDIIFASFTELEKLDISAADHTVEINAGVADGVICENAGNILIIDMPDMSAPYTTVPLPAGYNMIQISKIYDTSTVTGDVDLGAI